MNNNVNVLPFYRNINKQNHRKSYAYETPYQLATGNNRLLPFQIGTTADSIVSLKLFNFDGTEAYNLTAEVGAIGFSFVSVSGGTNLVYTGTLPFVTDIAEGAYYAELVLKITSTQEELTYYSEVFFMTKDLSRMLKIEYWDNEDLLFSTGFIKYASINYKNRVYLHSELGKPSYNFEEQASKRGGYTFIETQVSQKQFRFTFLAPEYLLDALRIVRLSDNVLITNVDGEQYKVDTFLMTPTWQTQGDLASVEAEFECDTVIKKNNKATLASMGGDFNYDFNNDFNNE